MKKIAWKHKIANFLAGNFKNIKGGYLGRERFILTCWIYRFLPYLGFDYCRLVEWQFILKNLAKKRPLKILDVGCCASLFIYELAHYGKTWGIDTRPYGESLPKNIKFLQADVLKMPFVDNYFDCITLVSVIEHLGLGSYQAPHYRDGDFKAMKELKRVLKKGGQLFLTTVIANQHRVNSLTRFYDEKRLNKLVKGFLVVKEKYYIFRKKWLAVNKKKAFQEPVKRFGLVCLQLRYEAFLSQPACWQAERLGRLRTP